MVATSLSMAPAILSCPGRRLGRPRWAACCLPGTASPACVTRAHVCTRHGRSVGLSATRWRRGTRPRLRAGAAACWATGVAAKQSLPMIPRYTRPEMAEIWAPETRFRIWFEIEAHAAAAMAELGMIPKAAAKAIWDKGCKANVRRCAHRRDRARGQARRHRLPHASGRARRARRRASCTPGLTSSDILDTCFQRAAGARRRPAARRPRPACWRR